MTETMHIDSIVVGERHRKDMGDLEALAASIRERGQLLQPIGVTPDGHLLFGERRLAACRLAGLVEVPVHILSDMDDAAARLRAERDENTCRKDMTREELVRLGLAIERVERPRARERKREHGGTAPGRPSTGGPETPSVGKTYDIVGDALGVSGATYKRAKAVVGAAEDESLPEEVREVAQSALAEMNETGKVTPAYEAVRDAKVAAGLLAAPDAPPEEPTDRTRSPRLHRKRAEAVLPRLLNQISGIALAVEGVDFSECRLTQDQFANFDASVTIINRVRRLLKENSQ